MKYSVEQMMFAATVRDLAVRRMHSEVPKNLIGNEIDSWMRERPIAPYVAGVVEEFEHIGDMIFVTDKP